MQSKRKRARKLFHLFSVRDTPQYGGMATELTDKMTSIKELIAKRKDNGTFVKKIETMKSYAEQVSDGYVASLHVIIDMSKYFETYRKELEDITQLINEDSVMQQLNGLDASIVKKMNQLNEFFKGQVEQLKIASKSIVDSEHKKQLLENLENVKGLVQQQGGHKKIRKGT